MGRFSDLAMNSVCKSNASSLNHTEDFRADSQSYSVFWILKSNTILDSFIFTTMLLSHKLLHVQLRFIPSMTASKPAFLQCGRMWRSWDSLAPVGIRTCDLIWRPVPYSWTMALFVMECLQWCWCFKYKVLQGCNFYSRDIENKIESSSLIKWTIYSYHLLYDHVWWVRREIYLH